VWTRGQLKTRAKAVLKLSYWKAFLVSLIIAISGAEGRGGGSGGRASSSNWGYGSRKGINGIIDQLAVMDLSVVITIVLLVLVMALAFRVFLGYALEVGGRRYFVQSAQYVFNLNELGFVFNKNRYINVMKTMLLRAIYNFLWYLLFIIPGVIMYYAYSMVPYILADNPNIGPKRAIEISNEMTDGHKFDMFVLDLSFIGWYLLGALLFLIGVVFVMPYEDATKAELYLVLRQNAIDNGVCTAEELGLNPDAV